MCINHKVLTLIFDEDEKKLTVVYHRLWNSLTFSDTVTNCKVLMVHEKRNRYVIYYGMLERLKLQLHSKI